MATYGCLFIFFGIKDSVYDYMTPFGNKWRITIWVFTFTFLLPALNIVAMYYLKRIPDLTLSRQPDRTYPYIMTSLFYFGLFYLMMDVSIWGVIKLFVAGGGLVVLLTALVNLRYKISAHMAGLGGLLGVIISVSYLIQFDLTLYYIILVLVAGVTGAARLVLREHRPAQLYLGFALGVAVQTGLFFALQKITFA